MIRHVVMLGTAPETRGGVAAVIQAYRAAGLFERWPVEYVATHADGGRAAKALAAVRGLRRFAALLAARGRVLVHVHCASRASFWRKCVFMAIAHGARCPVILHLHGGGFARFYAEQCGPLRRRIVRHFLRRAACVVVLSERWRHWVAGASGHPDIVCIPNPVRVESAPPRAAHRNTVLFLGRIGAAKGIAELIEALAGLRSHLADAELVCAGAGDTEAAARHAERLGVADAVFFPGWLDAGQKRAWLRRARVFALPSHAEGQPVSLLEAMAAGVPVVATAVGGIPDVVTDGINGLLVPPRDSAALERALRRTLGDPRLAAALGAAGRETVRVHYSPERVLAQLDELYVRLGLDPRAVRARGPGDLRRAA